MLCRPSVLKAFGSDKSHFRFYKVHHILASAVRANQGHPHESQQEQQLLQQQQQEAGSAWLPPTAWVSSVLSHLPHSVDVDSVTTYTQLLQNCLVLQPALLHTPPDQAAATCWQLERFTRSSAVWFGPDMISSTLLQHTPTSLSSHLSALTSLWLAHRQSPHSFGQLWLQAPSALLQRNVTEFESFLRQLGELVPELPPCDLLASGASLAGFLLSLGDVGELESHVHREVPGVIVISHPHIHAVEIQHQQQQQQQQVSGSRAAGRQQPQLLTVSVYGVVQPEQHRSQHVPEGTAAAVEAAAAAAAPASSSGQQYVPPWEQQLERKHTGGVYETPQRTPGGLAVDPAADSSSSSNNSSGGSSSAVQRELLCEVEVWVGGPDAPPLPLLVLPPQR